MWRARIWWEENQASETWNSYLSLKCIWHTRTPFLRPPSFVLTTLPWGLFPCKSGCMYTGNLRKCARGLRKSLFGQKVEENVQVWYSLCILVSPWDQTPFANMKYLDYKNAQHFPFSSLPPLIGQVQFSQYMHAAVLESAEGSCAFYSIFSLSYVYSKIVVQERKGNQWYINTLTE